MSFKVKFQGTVISEKFGKGSKSEHVTASLLTSEGSFKLRRVGGNPFKDDVIESLIGKKISCDGEIQSGQLVFDSYHII